MTFSKARVGIQFSGKLLYNHQQYSTENNLLHTKYCITKSKMTNLWKEITGLKFTNIGITRNLSCVSYTKREALVPIKKGKLANKHLHNQKLWQKATLYNEGIKSKW